MTGDGPAWAVGGKAGEDTVSPPAHLGLDGRCGGTTRLGEESRPEVYQFGPRESPRIPAATHVWDFSNKGLKIGKLAA